MYQRLPEPLGHGQPDQLGWTPTDTSLAVGAATGDPVAPGSPGLGSTAAVLAQAPAGGGFGTSVLGANLTLAIPATATARPVHQHADPDSGHRPANATDGARPAAAACHPSLAGGYPQPNAV